MMELLHRHFQADFLVREIIGTVCQLFTYLARKEIGSLLLLLLILLIIVTLVDLIVLVLTLLMQNTILEGLLLCSIFALLVHPLSSVFVISPVFINRFQILSDPASFVYFLFFCRWFHSIYLSISVLWNTFFFSLFILSCLVICNHIFFSVGLFVDIIECYSCFLFLVHPSFHLSEYVDCYWAVLLKK